MSQKLRNKGDVYAQRNLTSIPAPLDPDSDPEFNGGAFIPPPKAKKGRKSKTADAVSSRKNGRVQRRSDILDGIEHYGVAKSKAPRVRDAEAQNPLSEYFGELDLHSASEDEGEDYDPDPMDEDEEEEADPDEDTHDSPVVTRTMAGFERPAQSAIVQKVADANDDDSATESESDIELPPPLPLKRKSPDSSQPVPPVKRQRTASNDDDSATESETDEDMGVTSPVKTSTQPPPNSRPAAADSETESESESEMFSNPTLEPRPNFPLSKEQSHLPSLVLDQGKHIAVPASINTYLREYQRDGIRFFWNQYKEGRGGLLGDDMGLVKLSK
ncbi:hypothetical protein PLICRDRAFT_368459 [Plicaturopsis crispa FD-325 SS-3]|uniref:Uncharacterized protein n=1 Tax=Plicaturopsis crispa FD-325 SS-3 TaxID=944288 RepID=A0A0C9SX11_PLICR|nr:hypothetical protein PLICRDRAFT_368459 [Plicaturopsis crispa FD-325 SS-3]